MEPAEYKHKLRDLIVAAIDYRRIPRTPPPTQNSGLRSDVVLVAEHVSDTYLADAPLPAEAKQAVWAEVADDILTCLEHGRRDRLRASSWAKRERRRWVRETHWADLVRLWVGQLIDLVLQVWWPVWARS